MHRRLSGLNTHVQLARTMEHFTCQTGTKEITSMSRAGYISKNAVQERVLFWRPWTPEQCGRRMGSLSAYTNTSAELPNGKKPNGMSHPVKLFWPKSRCFDYLYQDAEVLLRNYPVQATICPYADSSSGEDEDSDEEDEKEMN